MFVSLENLNCKFILYSVMYLIVMIGLNLLSTIIQNSSQNLKAFTKKIPLMLLINHFFLLFCGIKRIVECIKDKSKDKSKDKIINDEKGLIYNEPKELDPMDTTSKDQFIIIGTFLLDGIYYGLITINQKQYEKKTELVINHYYKFLDVLFLFLIFKIYKKIRSYSHQYFSIAIVMISGFGKFISNIYFNGLLKEFKPLLYILLLSCPTTDSFKIFSYKRFVSDTNISLLNIGFFIALFYLPICPILLSIFHFVGTKVDFIQTYFSLKGLEFPTFGEIGLLCGVSLAYSSKYLVDLIILNKFSPFHLILLATFGDLITDGFFYFKKYPNFNTAELVIRISLYVFEILGILIFIETIILKCCGLDRNVGESITIRGIKDVKKTDENYKSRNNTDMTILGEEKNMGENDNNNNEDNNTLNSKV